MADEKTSQVTPETKATEEKAEVATKVESTPTAVNAKSGLGIASLVLGIVGIVGSWIPILNNISFIVAILGVIFGAVGLRSVLKGKKSGKGIAIAGLVISIIACVIVIGTQSLYSKAIDDASNSISSASNSNTTSSTKDKSSDDSFNATEAINKLSGDATDEILANDLDVDIQPYHLEYKSMFDRGNLIVTLTNKMTESKSFSVEIEAVDSTGNRIQNYNEYAYGSNLGAGQSQTVELFPAISEEDVTKYSNATFKIVKVTESL